MSFGATLDSLYKSASSSAQSAFNSAAKTTQAAIDALANDYNYAKTTAKQAVNTVRQGAQGAYSWTAEEASNAYAYGARKADQAYDYSKAAAKSTQNYVADKLDVAEKAVTRMIDQAKASAAKFLNSQPAGAPIIECPLKSKADRVKARTNKISAAKDELKALPKGPAKVVLAHAVTRLERTNRAVERLRLANDTYTVNQVTGNGERPAAPEGWVRVGKAELAKMGVDPRLFPQFRRGFKPEEYADGFYPEVYKSDKNVFGEEVYVLALRGTQGTQDWLEGNAKQAFGMKSEHYEQAKNIGRNLKAALDRSGKTLEVTGDSLGGGMSTAVAITSQVHGYTSDTAGVHPDTLGTFDRADAEGIVENYYTKGEILTSVQNPTVQRSMMAGLAVGGGLPAVAVMELAGHRAIFDQGTMTFGAAGTMYEVPALANPDEIAEATAKGNPAQGMKPGLAGRLNNDFNLFKKVAMHKDMNYVIAGVEQQKADDLAVIGRATAR